MAWFAWQSALFILLGFALGVLVGWWFWRIQWRRVAFTESEAVTVISRRHERVLAEKDSEISRLQGLLAGGAAATAADAASGSDAVLVTDSSDETSDADVDTTVDTTVDSDVDATADTDVDTTADVDADADATADGGTADEATAADESPDVVALPESDEPAATEVVDVTDDAVAEASAPEGTASEGTGSDGTGSDEATTDDDATSDDATSDDATSDDATARAVAGLPTQSGGEGDVIDVSDSAVDASGTDTDVASDTTSDTASDAAADGDADAATGGQGTEAADAAASGAVAAPVAAGLLSAPSGDAAGSDSGDSGDSGDEHDDAHEDDLERIEGIGPRIASALRSAGIRSFRRLAAADVPTLQAALEAAGLRFAPSLPTWSRQARFLADGDEAGFIKLTESLVAGREPGRSR